MEKAASLRRVVRTPQTSAAVSSSRIARARRPAGEGATRAVVPTVRAQEGHGVVGGDEVQGGGRVRPLPRR